MLEGAALLLALLGLAHSVLGERYILVRLFRRELPPLFGGTAFTRNTLRFAWHLTTLLALGISAVLWQLGGDPPAAAIARTPAGMRPAAAAVHPRPPLSLGVTVGGRGVVPGLGRALMQAQAGRHSRSR